MSKKTIWFVTFALSATLIGLFIVQGYWIRDAIRINEQHFDQLINKTLNNVVKQLENQEVVYQIINEVEPYEHKEAGINKVVSSHLTKTQQKKYALNHYSLDKQILEISSLDSIDFNARFNLPDGKRLQLGSEDQRYEMSESLKKTFRQRLENELQTDLSEKRVFVENIVNKLIQVDVGIENRIDTRAIDTILNKELRDSPRL